MNILFDITHPAHVHLFKHVLWELESSGHDVWVTSRDKDVTVELLDAYDIPHQLLSATADNKRGLVREWIQREYRLLQTARWFSPDVMVARYNPAVAHVSKLVGSRNVLFKSSNVESAITRFTYPFVDCICTPKDIDLSFDGQGKQYTIDALQELSYLHPNYFESNTEELRDYGVSVDSKYYLLRFISWNAHHDIGQDGFSREAKRTLVEELDRRGQVYISTEGDLPAEFEPYRLPVPAHLIHDLMYHADLYVGDSQTMATEAALLGTPSIRSNSFAGPNDMTYFKLLEKEYDLVYSVPDEKEALAKAFELEEREGTGAEWEQKAISVIDGQVDPTQKMVDLILGKHE